MKNMFTRIVLLGFMLLPMLAKPALAQQHHFIYIQSDNKQPFYVILNNKNYSASSVGYLIIPKLTEGTYTFTLGFPQNSFPELQFTCTLQGKDLGFALKNFGDKGWGLFNLETLGVVMGVQKSAVPSQSIAKTTVKNSNEFGNMLSDVVGDSTLTNSATRSGTEVKPQSDTTRVSAGEVSGNQVSGSSQTATDTEPAENSVDSIAEQSNTKGIIKASEQTGETGTSLVFIDFNNNSSDTVEAFIPAENAPDSQNQDSAKVQFPGLSGKDTVKGVPSAEAGNIPEAPKQLQNVAVESHPPTDKIENPFYNPDGQRSVQSQPAPDSSLTVSSGNQTVPISKPENPPAPETGNAVSFGQGMVKNDCVRMATELDLEKIKKKMVVESDATEMILDAKKILKGKCVTTAEVKNLGGLFLSDDGRYNFYEAMYRYTFDYGNYSSLESQLIDTYYKRRFEAMLR